MASVSSPTGSSTLSVGNTLITNSRTGLAFQSSTAGSNILDNVQFVRNGTGLSVTGTSAATPATMTVQNSVVVFNDTTGILSAGYSVVKVAKSTVVNNGVGLQAQNAGALLEVSGSTVSGNSTGWAVANGGWLYSSGSNSITGNTTNNSALPTTATPPAPPPPPVPPPTPAPSSCQCQCCWPSIRDRRGEQPIANVLHQSDRYCVRSTRTGHRQARNI